MPKSSLTWPTAAEKMALANDAVNVTKARIELMIILLSSVLWVS